MIDLHMHTIYSDGKNSIEEMVQTAINLGLKKIAITDHIWRSSNWFDDYCNEIIELRNKYPQIEILIGFEAKALSTNGEIDATKSIYKRADLRIGAIHRIPKSEKLGEFFTRDEVLGNKNLAYHNWFETMKNLIKNPNVDIIAHPFMVLYKYNIEPKEENIDELFELAKKYDTKLEISSRYKKSNQFILLVLLKNPSYINYISYGSDAHSVNDLKKAVV